MDNCIVPLSIFYFTVPIQILNLLRTGLNTTDIAHCTNGIIGDCVSVENLLVLIYAVGKLI